MSKTMELMKLSKSDQQETIPIEYSLNVEAFNFLVDKFAGQLVEISDHKEFFEKLKSNLNTSSVSYLWPGTTRWLVAAVRKLIILETDLKDLFIIAGWEDRISSLENRPVICIERHKQEAPIVKELYSILPFNTEINQLHEMLRGMRSSAKKTALELQLSDYYMQAATFAFEEAARRALDNYWDNTFNALKAAYSCYKFSRFYAGKTMRDPNWRVLIMLSSQNPEAWWALLGTALKHIGTTITELTKDQFYELDSLLNTGCQDVIRSQAVFLVWLLSDCRDLIRFPLKPKFNAVRQDYMITPRVSFSKLAACKIFENYTKEELWGQLFETSKIRKSLEFFFMLTFKDAVTYIHYDKIIADLKPVKADRQACYLVNDGTNTYFIVNIKADSATSTDWRAVRCPEQIWQRLKTEHNLPEPKPCKSETKQLQFDTSIAGMLFSAIKFTELN
jgi:hypothetical protein